MSNYVIVNLVKTPKGRKRDPTRVQMMEVAKTAPCLETQKFGLCSLIRHAPKASVMSSITSDILKYPDDEALLQLGKFFHDTFIQACMLKFICMSFPVSNCFIPVRTKGKSPARHPIHLIQVLTQK